jgi:hypothetical protein
MGLKGYRLLVNLMQPSEPHHGVAAAPVAFESKGLHPGDHIAGSRVQTRRFRAMGQTCTGPTTDVITPPKRVMRTPMTKCAHRQNLCVR